MKFIEVHYKVMGAGRDKILFRMDGEVWVVALIGKEGLNTSGHIWGIIVGEFCKQK